MLSSYSTGTGVESHGMEDLIKVPDEGELVVDMVYHRQQVDGEAYRLLVVGLNASYSCRTSHEAGHVANAMQNSNKVVFGGK